MRTIGYLLIFLMISSASFAHSPILADAITTKTKTDPFRIEKPEHSKAIFAVLTGQSHYYRIQSDVPFKFYAGITAPKLENCGLNQTFSFEVLDESFKLIEHKSGDNFDWTPWYEKWGKKWYWIGPEVGKKFLADRTYQAGTYYIRVFNQTNNGKYVLAVGDVEEFGIRDVISLPNKIRKINSIFWDEGDCQ